MGDRPAAFIPKSPPNDVLAYRPMEPPNPTLGVAICLHAIVRGNEATLQPRRINNEGFVPGSDAETLSLATRIWAERAGEWRDRTVIVNVGLIGAFGSIYHE